MCLMVWLRMWLLAGIVAGVVAGVVVGDVDDADAAGADVAHDLVLPVETVLAGGQLVAVAAHVAGAVAPAQARHGLAPPAGDPSSVPGEARDGDGEGEGAAAAEEPLPSPSLLLPEADLVLARGVPHPDQLATSSPAEARCHCIHHHVISSPVGCYCKFHRCC